MSLMAKAGIGPLINKGHIYTMIVALVTGIGVVVEHHYNPTVEAVRATTASQEAVDKAAIAASKAAVLEETVTRHSSELTQISSTLSDVKTAVVVLQNQGAAAQLNASAQNEKIDKILIGLSRIQGAIYDGHLPPEASAK